MTDNAVVYDGGGGTEQLINDTGATITYTGSTGTAYADIEVPLADSGNVVVTNGTLYLATSTLTGSPTAF